MIEPKNRNIIGLLAIIAWIIGWSWVVIQFSDILWEWPVLLQLPIYVIAGLGWVLPLKPLLVWMNKDR